MGSPCLTFYLNTLSYWSETHLPSGLSRDSLRTQCRHGNCLEMSSLHGWYFLVGPPFRIVR